MMPTNEPKEKLFHLINTRTAALILNYDFILGLATLEFSLLVWFWFLVFHFLFSTRGKILFKDLI